MARTNIRRGGGYMSKKSFRARWGRKGRRTLRKRRSGMKAYTMFKGAGYTLPYRSKKLSASAFRRKLWQDTLSSQHYRSVDSNAVAQTTGATTGAGSVGLYTPLLSAAGGNPFWTVAGGLLPPDTAGVSPIFRGDVVLRGGKIGISISAAGTVPDATIVKVWTVKTVSNPIVARVVTPQSLGWDPSMSPDFISEFGRVISYREACINGNFPILTVEHRLKVQKIDQASFVDDFGHQYVFIVHVVNAVDTTDTSLTVIPYHNVSFSADATT